jgi:hypothetical protein
MVVRRSDVVVVCLVWSRFVLLVNYWSDSDGSEDCNKTSRTTLNTEKANFSETLLSIYSNIHGVMCQKAGTVVTTRDSYISVLAE